MECHNAEQIYHLWLYNMYREIHNYYYCCNYNDTRVSYLLVEVKRLNNNN